MICQNKNKFINLFSFHIDTVHSFDDRSKIEYISYTKKKRKNQQKQEEFLDVIKTVTAKRPYIHETST